MLGLIVPLYGSICKFYSVCREDWKKNKKKKTIER